MENSKQEIEKEFKEIQKITSKDIEMMIDKWGKLELDIVSCLLKKILEMALVKAKSACKKVKKNG